MTAPEKGGQQFGPRLSENLPCTHPPNSGKPPGRERASQQEGLRDGLLLLSRV